MFTGIILAVGSIAATQARGGDQRLRINTGELPLTACQLGDSIAVNGVCLTATELGSGFFCADVSNETLSRTTLRSARPGMPVNLELALTPSSRLGGHIVSGHVDGIARLADRQSDARSQRLSFRLPDALAKYVAEKGSICIDGVSLTVNSVDGPVFAVNIVPHTLKATTLGRLQTGDEVNIEVDLLARYLERLMKGEAASRCHGGVTAELLVNSGFING